MGKKVYLHIGGEKTGTTTLQHFLTRNASKLKRAGYYYPCETNNICFENGAHFPVAAGLIGESVDFVSEERRHKLRFVLGALTQALSTKQSVILSCEHFSSRLIHRRQLETLRDALSADDVKVVYYMREPSDLAMAAWSTGVRYGAKHAFNAAVVAPENRYFNHLEILNFWGSVFGEQNLIVREYNRASLTEGDIRKDFCGLLGIQTAHMEFEEDKNRSLDVQRLQVLRYINCALSEFHEVEAEWRRAEKIRQLVSFHIPSGGQLTTLMTGHERTLIKSRFATVNSEISQRFFAGQLSPDWFPDYTAQAETSPRDSCDEDIATVLRETIIRMAEANIEYETKRQVRNAKRPLRRLTKTLKQRFVQKAFRAASTQ
jgi:hypothetical protein